MLDAGKVLNFDAESALAQALASHGKNPLTRSAQRLYADHLAACLDAGRVALIDAETGVGKTLGYLVPMVARAVARRANAAGAEFPLVVVSTASVALQQQIIADDLPVVVDAVERATGLRLAVSLRVGKQQVVDLQSMLDAAEELGAGQQDMLLADELAEWCAAELAQGNLPLRSAMLAAFADRFRVMPTWLAAELIGLAPGEPGAHAKTEQLFREKLAESDEADILVVNHHLLALHMRRPFLWRDERPVFLAVDEADRLPGIVEDMGRAKVP